MAIRIKLLVKVRDTGVSLKTVALVNTGFETESPQLLLPIEAGKNLGLWPPKSGAKKATYDTAGGPTEVWVYPNSIAVHVLVEDVETEEILADAVISPVESEVLISDKLMGALKIAIEDGAEGLWRFRFEGLGRLRKSEKPQFW